MYFKRKAYNQLLNWKENYADNYAVLLEGARRVGKSTIAEQFARNEYASYLLIDFSNASMDKTRRVLRFIIAKLFLFLYFYGYASVMKWSVTSAPWFGAFL